MLSEREKTEIQQELANYRQKQAGCVEALKIVQKSRGWVSDESIADIAELLEMTWDELDSIATFYSLIYRKQVGRHVILLCDSVTCHLMGYGQLLEHLSGRLGIKLGETTSDGRFTLLPVACLGACDRSPAMMIDDDLHVELSAEKIDAILESYR